jgi:hypothetical protein
MRYRLIVTTDGREGHLQRALESFSNHVRPRPQEVVIVDDTGDREYHDYLRRLLYDLGSTHGSRTAFVPHDQRVGFCGTVGDAWKFAADDVFGPLPDTPPPWVFWLEDDFVFNRTVPLVDLAYTMERQEQLVQISLLRQPVSDEEKAAGGYLNIDPERFTRRGSGQVAWLEHQAFWTTNPSLFRTEVAQLLEWPSGEDHCEGVFTHRLLDARPDVTFGVWGVGEPWVEHLGERVGVGY